MGWLGKKNHFLNLRIQYFSAGSNFGVSFVFFGGGVVMVHKSCLILYARFNVKALWHLTVLNC